MPRGARVLVLAAALSSAPTAASAHPQGIRSINHWAELAIDSTGVTVKYLLDFAEVPSFTELERVDPDLDEQVTAEERTAYLDARTAEVLERLRLEVNGRSLPLEALWSRVVFPPGDDGLSTVRIAWELRADFAGPLTDSNLLVWADRNHEAAPGWKEIDYSVGPGLGIGSRWPAPWEAAGAVFPEVSPVPPPDDTRGWCRFGPGMEPSAVPVGPAPDSRRPVRDSGRVVWGAAVGGLLLGLGLGTWWIRRKRATIS